MNRRARWRGVFSNLPQLVRHLALPLIAGSIGLPACDNAPRQAPDPPLRPLLYTEGSDQEDILDMEGWEIWTHPEVDPHAYPSSVPRAPATTPSEEAFDLRSPEGLIRSAYYAATHGDLETLEGLILKKDELRSVARIPQSQTEARHRSLQNSMQNFMLSFRPESATDARADNLSGLIQPTAIELGAPRRIDGSVVSSVEEAEMYSSNRLRIHVLNSSIDFDVRFPRILKDEEGLWKFSEGPVVDNTWHNFRRPGLDLKPALLQGEHAPFPFDVGNYWHYELKRIPLNAQEDAEEIPPTRSLAYRDTVSDVHNGNIFQVVTLRRTFADPARTPQSRRLLVTPRHIYPCTQMCYSRRNNLRFLLQYMSRTTPTFVFPATQTLSWRQGGHRDGRTTRMADRSEEAIVVPAGSFNNSVRITATTGAGSQVVYFQEGIGVLREEHRDGDTVEQANLVQYRILR